MAPQHETVTVEQVQALQAQAAALRDQRATAAAQQEVAQQQLATILATHGVSTVAELEALAAAAHAEADRQYQAAAALLGVAP